MRGECIPDQTLNDIAKRIGGVLKTLQSPLIQELVEDVASRYQRACKKIVLNVALSQDAMQSRYTALKLPTPETKTAAPEFGIVMIPKSLTPYEKIRKVVQKRLWLKMKVYATA